MENNKIITELLQEWNKGNTSGLNNLLTLVYDELHRQAARFLRRERGCHTLQTTALINETYLKLIDQKSLNCENRAHFFAICAKLMRRILVDYARTKHRRKRGGKLEPVSLEKMDLGIQNHDSIDLIALDESLSHLAKIDEQQSRIVELKYFGGLSLDETAKALNISRTTVARDWAMAKSWLHRELTR